MFTHSYSPYLQWLPCKHSRAPNSLIFIILSFYCSICSKPLFFALQYFSVFKQATVSWSFLPCNASLSKQTALFSCPHILFLSFQFYPLLRGQLFLLIRFFISLLYIMPLVPINKQFSFDSFFDWESHHWDFSSSHSIGHCSQLLPTHLTG